MIVVMMFVIVMMMMIVMVDDNDVDCDCDDDDCDCDCDIVDIFKLVDFTSADQDPRGRQYLQKYIQNLQNDLFRQQDLKTFNTM